MKTLTGHTDAVRALAVSNGRLFSGSYDGSVKVGCALPCCRTSHESSHWCCAFVSHCESWPEASAAQSAASSCGSGVRSPAQHCCLRCWVLSPVAARAQWRERFQTLEVVLEAVFPVHQPSRISQSTRARRSSPDIVLDCGAPGVGHRQAGVHRHAQGAQRPGAHPGLLRRPHVQRLLRQDRARVGRGNPQVPRHAARCRRSCWVPCMKIWNPLWMPLLWPRHGGPRWRQSLLRQCLDLHAAFKLPQIGRGRGGAAKLKTVAGLAAHDVVLCNLLQATAAPCGRCQPAPPRCSPARTTPPSRRVPFATFATTMGKTLLSHLLYTLAS